VGAFEGESQVQTVGGEPPGRAASGRARDFPRRPDRGRVRLDGAAGLGIGTEGGRSTSLTGFPFCTLTYTPKTSWTYRRKSRPRFAGHGHLFGGFGRSLWLPLCAASRTGRLPRRRNGFLNRVTFAEAEFDKRSRVRASGGMVANEISGGAAERSIRQPPLEAEGPPAPGGEEGARLRAGQSASAPAGGRRRLSAGPANPAD